MTFIKVGTFRVDVCDHECKDRPCFHLFQDKGSFTPGRGYTAYHKTPKWVCGQRHLHGCPWPLPERVKLVPEEVRCCHKPDFPKSKSKSTPKKQRCRSCGQWAEGDVLDARRQLEHTPNASPCTHPTSCRVSTSLGTSEITICSQCHGYIPGKPDTVKAHQPTHTFPEIWAKYIESITKQEP